MSRDAEAQRLKRRQQLVAGGTIAVVLVGAVVYLVLRQPGPVTMASFDPNKAVKINDLSGASAPEKNWLNKAEERFGKLEKTVDFLNSAKTAAEKEVDRLKSELKATNEAFVAAEKNAKEVISAQADAFEKLEGENKRLQDQVQAVAVASPTAAPNAGNQNRRFVPSQGGQSAGVNGDFVSRQNGRPRTGADNLVNGTEAPRGGVEVVTFSLDQPAGPGRSRSTRDYVPAGAYAAAEIISGVDASTSVTSQADPRPMLIRITGPAKSAALKGAQIQETDIIGCTVTVAATGDLSSEKVYGRLQRMTCTRKAGEVMETDVKGYLVGAGKAGIRGEVVSREGDLVMQSFFAGVAGGVGKTFSQTLGGGMAGFGGLGGSGITINTGETEAPSFGQVAKSGIGQGLGNAGDRLSDYLIKRAEQYQPVITAQPGPVEVVFIEGFHLDGRSAK